MTIFNQSKERLDTSAKLHTQTNYQYLNQSGTPYAQKIREVLNNCFDLYDYDEAEKREILQRIRGSNEVNFHSACFELFVNALLVNQGYKLLPHPVLEHSAKHPDFLVTSPSGEEFYLELVTGVENTHSSHLNSILDVFEKNSHPNFLISIKHNNGEMTNSPKTSELKKFIFSWLDSLNPDDVLSEIKEGIQNNTGSMFDGPSKIWTHEGFEIKMTAIPVSLEKRGKTTRLYGIGFSGVVCLKNDEIIRSSLKVKSGRYGDLDKPFIIATALRPSHFSFGLDEDDKKQALFGSYQWIFNSEANTSEIIFSGQGLWIYNNQPTNTRVSGVWFFNNIDCYSLKQLESDLFINPWSQMSLDQVLNEFSKTTIDLTASTPFKKTNGTINSSDILMME
ncbi:hypothetical protein [Acinetobacter nosocomialis]|uniref:hypothetical protein n=1 Tax=Acinetobacter nosocomialis TaxID=106654 RepID=UPI001ADC917A|nr:hypothetical protein [Acinetobacter nosocomialis]MBO8214190.1 hypothetical protein [Acinetobacter nosocomialis]